LASFPAESAVSFPRIFLAGLFVLAGFLAFEIAPKLYPGSSSAGSHDVLSQILGSSKEIIGDMMFLKADSYYHGGVAEKFHEDEKEVHQEGAIESEKEKPAQDWIAGINSKVRSEEHRHLSHGERKEMLPFFALSTTLDPHNVEAVLTAAYWLE